MSASREKLKRKAERENGVQEKKKVEVSPQLFRNLVTVLCVVAVLAVICVAVLGTGVPQQHMTAATAEGKPVSVAEFNYHYYNAYQNFYNTYYYYFSYFGIDPEKSLAKQKTGEGNETWHDYLVAQTLTAVKEAVHFSELANSEGITLTEDDTENIESTIESIREYAAQEGISENAYVKRLFGRGVTMENLRMSLERDMLSRRYQQTVNDSFAYTDDEVGAYYEENKNEYERVTYRSFSVTKELSDEEYDSKEAEGIDLAAEVETPLGTMTAEHKLAYDVAVSLTENPGLKEETFNELARELAPEDSQESYDDEDYTLTEEGTYSDDALNNWLFDAARKPGDVTVIDNDTEFTAVMFIERIADDYKSVTMRHIYIVPESESSNGEYTEAEWDAANRRAEAVLEQFKGAGAKESDFEALVEENSDDSGTKSDGGLYEELGKDELGVDEVDEWLFDESRKSGDYTTVKSDYGYHIMYFVDYGRAYKYVEAENTMRSDAYSAKREELLANVAEPVKSWVGQIFIVKA